MRAWSYVRRSRLSFGDLWRQNAAEPGGFQHKRLLHNLAWSGNVYSLELMPEARDDLAGLDKPVARRILNKLAWLAENLDAVTLELLTGNGRASSNCESAATELSILSTGQNNGLPFTSSSTDVRSTRRDR